MSGISTLYSIPKGHNDFSLVAVPTFMHKASVSVSIAKSIQLGNACTSWTLLDIAPQTHERNTSSDVGM